MVCRLLLPCCEMRSHFFTVCFLWLSGLCPGCGLLLIVGVVYQVDFCVGLMPLPYVFRGGVVLFLFYC